MKRIEILKKIGNSVPSIYHDREKDIESLNFGSIFIIPFTHNFYQQKYDDSINKKINENWEINNNEVESTFFCSEIKKHVLESFLPTINEGKEKEHFLFKKNYSLRYKGDKESFIFKHKGNDYKLLFKEIDLWIMKREIAFISYQIELEKENIEKIETISTVINRELRDFRSLYINLEDKTIEEIPSEGKKKKEFLKDKISLLRYFLELTVDKNTKESFLNVDITSIEKKFSLVSNKEQKENDLTNETEKEIIYDSTQYAKMITSIHISDSKIEIEEIVPLEESIKNSFEFNIIAEASYNLGTVSSFDLSKEKSFLMNEQYVYNNLNKTGIHIWKFWSGVVLKDSCSFFSLNEGRSDIVFKAKSTYYFLYILTFYINLRLKFYEHYLIDEDFIDIDKIYPLEKEIQDLKNQLIPQEISLRFQPNIVSEKINLAFNNVALLDSVESKVQNTYKYTKANTDVVFSFIVSFITLGTMWLSMDDIKHFYEESPLLTLIIFISLTIFAGFLYIKRSSVIKFLKGLIKKTKRKIDI